jgi:hypothetical protein
MLRNALEDYLNSIIERDFDYPLTSLLQAMGFYDIHFTHGGVEFGKDFIAKKLENEIEYQYALQSKKGNINQSLWRNEIRGQLEETILSDLSHPQFNTNLPRKSVLVTTGRLTGNARLASQEFKTKLQANNEIQELIFWEKEQLVQFAEEFGLSGIHQNTAKGLKGFADFYLTYSKAIEGNLSDREIEEFSRLWNDDNLDYKKRIFRASIEAEIIASKLVESELLYETIIVYLSLARVVMQVTYENNDDFVIEIYKEVVNEKILTLCKLFFDQLKSDWENIGKSLLHLCLRYNSFPMIQYIVWCARIAEIGSLQYFLTTDESEKTKIIDFLSELIKTEDGFGHIPSDKYAVSLVWITLALLKAGRRDEAKDLVKESAIWLFDRVEEGFGLARYEADEFTETNTLLGYPFDFINIEKNRSSFLATIISDLAAFIGDKQFYSDVVNDIEACEIAYNYWQFPDTKAIFKIETEECRNYPNIPHQDSLNDFNDFEHSAHLKDEPRTFAIVDKVGKESLILLSLLLKDRYFPTMWRQIISGQEA